MKRFANFFAALALALAFVQPDAVAKSDKAKEKAKTDKKPGSAGQAKTDTKPKLDIPIPKGESGEGLTIPYYNERGQLQMSFKIESATRTDENHLTMQAVKIE